MRPKELQDVLHVQPFVPFRIHLSNGKTYDVRHPELAVVGHSTMFLGMPATNSTEVIYDRFAIITLLHINCIEPLPPVTATSANGPGQSP